MQHMRITELQQLDKDGSSHLAVGGAVEDLDAAAPAAGAQAQLDARRAAARAALRAALLGRRRCRLLRRRAGTATGTAAAVRWLAGGRPLGLQQQVHKLPLLRAPAAVHARCRQLSLERPHGQRRRRLPGQALLRRLLGLLCAAAVAGAGARLEQACPPLDRLGRLGVPAGRARGYVRLSDEIPSSTRSPQHKCIASKPALRSTAPTRACRRARWPEPAPGPPAAVPPGAPPGARPRARTAAQGWGPRGLAAPAP